MPTFFFVTFEETVYGKRDGSISGLAIVSRDPRNVFRTTRAFKTGIVLNVPMLPRSEMYKPEQVGIQNNHLIYIVC